MPHKQIYNKYIDLDPGMGGGGLESSFGRVWRPQGCPSLKDGHTLVLDPNS